MASIVRPVFSEGQVLAAADLQAQTDYARIEAAIHERSEHIWGIASGLQLSLDKGVVSVAAGVAVDPSGRHVVVTEARTITAEDFRKAGVWSRGTPAGTKFPLLLVAQESAKSSNRTPGRCTTDAQSAMEERAVIQIGFPGSERNIVATKAPASPVALPATNGTVLLGFVTWDETIDGFKGVEAGQGVRYAGVRASSVIPHDGVLSLITTEADPRFVLQLSQGAQGAELRFGRQTGTAPLSALFVVDDKGDVTIAGKINSAIPQVPVSMSGQITHGLKLPLPPTFTEEMIGDGRVSVEYIVTLRQQPQMKTFSSGTMLGFPIPIECWVDSDPKVRTVRCRCMWIAIGALDAMVDSGIADYLLVATPKATP